MKRALIAIVALCAIAVAADRVSQWTSSTPRTVTKAVQDVRLIYDVSDPAVPLARIILRCKVTYDDGTPAAIVNEEWTKAMIDALPTMATNAAGNLVANTFRSQMLARWSGSDLIPDIAVVGWKNPLFMVPSQ